MRSPRPSIWPAGSPAAGAGATRERWTAFADLAGEDLSLARLCEGHADAVAILAELGGPRPEPGSRWGVWAANPPGPNVTASRAADGWLLEGAKQYCSGARICTHVLVTAAADDGARLFAVDTELLEPDVSSWPATGMAGSDTLDVGFTRVPAVAVGPPGGYTDRPGFSHGGVGVAACWYGGARASRGRCSAPRPSATSGRTRWPIWGRSISGCARRGRRSSRPPTRSTPTRAICVARDHCGPCGCAR